LQFTSRLRPVELPAPFNLWQNTPVDAKGSIKHYPPVTKKGDYIIMRAEMDLSSGDSILDYPGSGFGPGRLGAEIAPVKASSSWTNSTEPSCLPVPVGLHIFQGQALG
jgi:hypothetical protein